MRVLDLRHVRDKREARAGDVESPAPGAAASALFWGLLGSMAVVPMLLDLPNVDDTYYGIKARVLIAIGGVLALSLLCVRPRLRRAIDRPLALYAAAVVAATVTSIAPLYSLWGAPARGEGTLVLLSYAAIAAAAARLAPARATALIAAMTAATLVVAAYGVAQYFGVDPVLRDPVRAEWRAAFGTTGNPNWLGGYMVMILPMVLALSLGAPHPWAAAGWSAALGLLQAALLCTLGRAAWAGAAIALGTMLALLALTRTPVALRRMVAAGAVLVAVTFAFFVPRGPFAREGQPSPGLARAGSLEATELPEAVGIRPTLWRLTLPLIAARPLLGYGPETLQLVFPQPGTDRWTRVAKAVPDVTWMGARPVPNRVDKAHNQLLDLAMSCGVAGVAGYLWAFAAMWRTGWRRIGGLPAPLALLRAGALAGTLGYLFQIQWHFSVVSVAPIYWCLLGVGAGLGDPDGQQV